VALGDLERAERARLKAEEVALLFRSRAWTAAALSCRGHLAAARQDWQVASESFTTALRTFEALEQPYDVARSLELLADATDALSRPVADAATLRRRAADLYVGLGVPR
jgi:hypothetical protein